MLKIMLVSLGCDKNTADSSKMLGILSHRGYELTSEIEEADVAVVNTCCFIQSATEESIDKVFELASYKESGLKYLIVAGCMAERFKDEIAKDIPEVDAFIGTGSLEKIADVIAELEKADRDEGEESSDAIMCFDGEDTAFAAEGVERYHVITERPYSEYLKIADGCDKRCTYCAIPNFKGKYKSVPMELIVKEAEKLAADGVKELILVAQETTCYGIDIYGEKRLHILLRKLSEVDGIEWIRLLYCYPEEIYDELIDEMAENSKVLKYIDMPVQHTETEVLRRMGRRIDKEGIYSVVKRLRDKMPDIAIRTTLIAGFPGETEEQHKACLEALDELEFDRVGVFNYSREDGTAAADFPDQIDDEVKDRYSREIMELSAEVSEDKNSEFVGRDMDVIIEGYLPDEDIYAARSYRDAPDVDGLVYLKSETELMSGSVRRVKVTGYDTYDLTAELEQAEE
ncbi:MAG: 30S ribosomal protein S12 methylthiotransferase RimO [Eubacterium sp.]|nr:30S ribosomal protein S12 methylthiotransferase RimO [Eubacterium sp.]